MSLLQRGIGGVPLRVWFFTMVVLVLVPKIESLSADDLLALETGLTAGKEILGYIKDHKFTKAVTKLAESASDFLGALGPFVNFVLTFVSADSSELTYLKEMMKEIDRRFGMVDSKLEYIQTLIEWINLEKSLQDIELNVQTMDSVYRNFHELEGSASNKTHYFITAYESTYELGGSKLYELTVRKSAFTDNLGIAIMKKTKYNRKQTNDYLLGVLKIIMQGMRIELAYYEMQYGETFYNATRDEWKKRIVKVAEIFDEIDKNVTAAYHAQSKVDTKELAHDNRPSSMGNSRFSVKLCDMLKVKYYWRDWFCVVFNEMESSSREHRITACRGHILNKEHGRSIAVASRDKTATRMNIDSAWAELERFTFKPYIGIMYDGRKIINSDFRAYTIYDKISVENACSIAVIRQNEDVYWHKSNATRLAWKALHRTWWAFVFG